MSFFSLGNVTLGIGGNLVLPWLGSSPDRFLLLKDLKMKLVLISRPTSIRERDGGLSAVGRNLGTLGL